VSYTSWNHNHIAGMHLDISAVLAAKLQSCSAIKNPKHLMRRAVIVGKGIDTVSPRICPVVLGKTLFNKRSAISRIVCECLPIH